MTMCGLDLASPSTCSHSCCSMINRLPAVYQRLDVEMMASVYRSALTPRKRTKNWILIYHRPLGQPTSTMDIDHRSIITAIYPRLLRSLARSLMTSSLSCVSRSVFLLLMPCFSPFCISFDECTEGECGKLYSCLPFLASLYQCTIHVICDCACACVFLHQSSF